ncbi:hypothetical protein L1279_003238 [Planomicrobium sp. HSC-17F08]|nr:hypothetical protein [Planomicrobium sp. HSC-17F08]
MNYQIKGKGGFDNEKVMDCTFSQFHIVVGPSEFFPLNLFRD